MTSDDKNQEQPRREDRPKAQRNTAPARATLAPRDEIVVQAYFDRDPLWNEARFREEIGRSPYIAEEIAATQRVLNILNEPIEGPDLSDRILDALDQQRALVLKPVPRRVSAWPIAVAASLIFGAGLIVALNKMSTKGPLVPEIPLNAEPLAGGLPAEEGAVTSAAKPHRAAPRSPELRPLTIGDTGRYDRESAPWGGRLVLRSPSSGREFVTISDHAAALRLNDFSLRQGLAMQSRPREDADRPLSVTGALSRTPPSARWNEPFAKLRLAASLAGTSPPPSDGEPRSGSEHDAGYLAEMLMGRREGPDAAPSERRK